MSVNAIAAVSTRLKKFLDDVLSPEKVELLDPTKTQDGSVSLWLYQVTVDEFTRNRPPGQAETAFGRQVRFQLPPLGVNLYYLIAPMFNDHEMAQTKLAQVLLALHEFPHLTVEPSGAEVHEVVRISL